MSTAFVQRKGFWLIIDKESDFQRRHFFCGENELIGSDCPNCKKKLLKILTLDTRDHRIEIKFNNIIYIHLLFCWTCIISQQPFYYRLEDDNSINIIGYGNGQKFDDFPYENYPEFFPGVYSELEELSGSDQKIISNLNSCVIEEGEIIQTMPHLCQPNHQIGGEPYLIQKESYKFGCIKCHKIMPLFASIGDKNLDHRGFSGNPDVQMLFFVCTDCSIICAIQRCD